MRVCVSMFCLFVFVYVCLGGIVGVCVYICVCVCVVYVCVNVYVCEWLGLCVGGCD